MGTALESSAERARSLPVGCRGPAQCCGPAIDRTERARDCCRASSHRTGCPQRSRGRRTRDGCRRPAATRWRCSPRRPASGSRAGPDPVRPDGRLAVRLLPRRHGGHGRRSRLDAAHRAAVQLCGDAHLVNFGVFAAPDRRLVFSVNDFDETLPGPFEWDVKRLCASLAVVGGERRLSATRRATIVRTAAATYRSAMHDFAAMGSMAIWYARLDARELISRWGPLADASETRALEQVAARARSKDNVRAMTRLTEVGGGERRFVNRPPVARAPRRPHRRPRGRGRAA